GDDTNPITHGYVCNKAFSIPAYVRHPQRVERPLRRRPDGSFEPVSWDRALEDIASRLGEIRARHGARSIALVGIGGQGNHMDAPWGLGFLWGLGSRRWFNAFAQEKTQHPLVDGWLMEASPGAFLHLDAEHTRYLILLGSNPKVSNRGHNATDTFRALAARGDCTVVAVDPRETETTRGADRHLRVTPGRDVYLLAALAAVIVQEGLEDHA
ncbi:MAG: molybdopterin-dependent oxidoreductase, partial [Myxococcales bacterium]|nr:molybdopterin-dependent oxidoreductase [Myxococcales bacterium]